MRIAGPVIGQYETAASVAVPALMKAFGGKSPAEKAAAKLAEQEAKIQAKASRLGIDVSILRRLRDEARAQGKTTDALIEEKGGIEAVKKSIAEAVSGAPLSTASFGGGLPGWVVPVGIGLLAWMMIGGAAGLGISKARRR